MKKQAYVKNPATGRLIAINGPAYQALKNSGVRVSALKKVYRSKVSAKTKQPHSNKRSKKINQMGGEPVKLNTDERLFLLYEFMLSENPKLQDMEKQFISKKQEMAK